MNNFIEYFYGIKIDKVIYNSKYYSFIYNGYIYRYDNEEKPLPVQVKHTHGRKTAQYDLEGNLLNIFDSAN